MSGEAGSRRATVGPRSARLRLRTLRGGVLAFGLAIACATSEPEVEPDADLGVVAEVAESAYDDWPGEVIALPPAFAPGLPSGNETLAFAPGMFAATSAEFWSYAFLLELDTAAPDAELLDDWLEQYYDGLLAAVAADKARDIGDDPATATVERTGPRTFNATLQIIDAFVTFDVLELDVRVRITHEAEGHCHLLFRVSPQAADHAVWAALADVGAKLDAAAQAACPTPNTTL